MVPWFGGMSAVMRWEFARDVSARPGSEKGNNISIRGPPEWELEIDAAAPSGYVVRRATREDLREVIRLNRENLPENYSEDFFEEVLESNPETFLVAEDRRKGVGMALMVEGMNALRSRGCSEVYLEVRVGNAPAISLYRKLGFRVSRRIPGYYRDGEDAFVMARSL